MDAGHAFVARSIEIHLGVRPEHVVRLPARESTEQFEAHLADRTVLFKADRIHEEGRVVLEAWACQRARELGAPVPQVLAVDLGRDSYPRHFIILEKVQGEPLSAVDLKPDQTRRVFNDAGLAIRTIHEVGVAGFGVLDEAEYLRSAHVQGAHDLWQWFLGAVQDDSIPMLREAGHLDEAGVERIDQVMADHADYYDIGPIGHLLHGKFDPAHVLVADGDLTGIVDFSDRCSGDPAWDLGGFLVEHLAETGHLLDGYGPDRDRAAVFEVTIPLYGGLRALASASRAHATGCSSDCDRLLEVANLSFRALGHR